MGKALYRQYRSTSFDEVIGQDHITTTLKNSLASGSIGHAYLLTGPRGTGKTSIARILAHAVNDLPYDKDGAHLDIIEIDAASNRRIDEIRSLRERVHIAPTSGKYKVYIIDEVHMLTREAFNALLKTLEEPPAHVIFILATTDFHKLPDTIVSRCITFTFRPIPEEGVVAHLKHIASSEGFKITDEALRLLARHGDGSFRDSISLLDQVKNPNAEVGIADIELALGLASEAVVSEILAAIQQGNPRALSEALASAYEHGASEINLSKQIAAHIRSRLVEKQAVFSSADALHILSTLLDVPSSPKPRAKLELVLLDQLFKAAPIAGPTPVAQPVPKPEPVATIEPTPGPEPVYEAPAVEPETVPEPEAEPAPEPIITQPAAPAEPKDTEAWNDILQKLKTQNNTLYGIARMAEAEMTDTTLTISFKFPFHYRQVNQAKNRSIITDIIEALGHKNLELVIVQVEKTKKSAASADASLTNINNIFGDSEVLES